jgi:hypothetical protein
MKMIFATQWTGPVFFASIVAVLGFLLGIYNAWVQRRTTFEARWVRFLEHLKSIQFPKDENAEREWCSKMALSVAFAALPGSPTMEDIQGWIRSYKERPLDTPHQLYNTFKSLAHLRQRAPLGQQDFLDQSLTSYLTTRHIVHVLYQTLKHADEKTLKFLIETKLLSLITYPSLKPCEEIFKVACHYPAKRSRNKS